MPSFALTDLETRILGCLLEKERLTPENYPLSLNSLAAACNQSTNRDPVASYDEKTVEAGVNALREKKLATVIFGTGFRVQKYRHNLRDHYSLSPADTALLCVLMLRGPQTPGELRSRTERMHAFENVGEVESCLAELGAGESPLIRFVPARSGQKEGRYVQLFSVEVAEREEKVPDLTSHQTTEGKEELSKIDALTKEVATLRIELQQLREEFAAFRQQFE